MAEVYRAALPGAAGFQKPLVIKRLHPHYAADPRFVSLFVEEAKLAACVQHRNVVQIFELGDHPAPSSAGRELYMALELVDGLDFKQLLRIANERQLRIPPWFTAYVGAEILDALIYAHDLRDPHGRRRNIVHCDVTPENIFLSTSGEAKLGDFGVARDDTRAAQDPFPGLIRGKLPYMSPEQTDGDRLTHASDVFSLGVVLWEALAQRRLFRGGTRAETIARIAAGPRSAPSAELNDIPLEFDQWVLAALRPSAPQRPSARQLRDGLRELVLKLNPRAYVNDLAEIVEAAKSPVQHVLTSIELVRDAKPDPALELYVAYLANDPKTPLGVPAAHLDAPWSEAMNHALDAAHTPTLQCPVPTFEEPLPIEAPVVGPRSPSPMCGQSTANEPVEADGSYSITKPPGPATLVSPGRWRPPIRAPRSRHETNDILKRPPQLKSDVPRPREDTIPPQQPPSTEHLWVRQGRQRAQLLVEEALEQLNASALAGREAEVSADGQRWLPFGHFARLLGETPPTPSSGKSVLHGQLQPGALMALLGRLARTKSSGRVRLLRESARDIIEVYVRGGRIVHVGATSTLFLSWLDTLRDVQMDREQLLGQLHKLTLEEEPFELITGPDVQSRLTYHRTRRAARKLLEPFSWSGGRFSFDTEPAPAWAGLAQEFTVASVLESAARRSDQAEELRLRLNPRMQEFLQPCPDFAGQAACLTEDRALPAQFTAARRLGEAIRAAGDDPCAIVFSHVCLELQLLSTRPTPA